MQTLLVAVWLTHSKLFPCIGRTKHTPDRYFCLQTLSFAVTYSWGAFHNQAISLHPHCRQVGWAAAHPCHTHWSAQSISKGRHEAESLPADLLSRYALFRRFGKDALLLTVLSYNVGTGTLLGGRNRPKSRLIRKLEQGDRNILPEYLSFCRYKGRVLPGLLKRRRVEFALFYIP